MEIEFRGKAVLVTGAARGIGSAIVRAFADAGADVLATDVLEDALEPLRGISGSAGNRVETDRLDVTDEADIGRCIGAQAQKGRAFDVFVHVAGGVLGQKRKPLEDVTSAEWDGIYDVNVKGAFLAARALAPGMKQRRHGKIVLISSGAGLGVSLTGIQAYASAKAAQIGLTRQLAHELGPFGINVNAVAPGFLRTSPDYERQWASYGEAGQQALIAAIPLRRIGEPQDIANAVLFLASPHAGWITGQTLSVDGGPTR